MKTDKWFDLRFVIGTLLGVLGILVLVQYGIDPVRVEGVPVNLLGGGMLLGVGALIAVSGFFGNDPT